MRFEARAPLCYFVDSLHYIYTMHRTQTVTRFLFTCSCVCMCCRYHTHTHTYSRAPTYCTSKAFAASCYSTVLYCTVCRSFSLNVSAEWGESTDRQTKKEMACSQYAFTPLSHREKESQAKLDLYRPGRAGQGKGGRWGGRALSESEGESWWSPDRHGCT